MTEVLFHRGPDSDGYFVEPPIGLGFRRLSIIDLEGGAQPLSNETGTVQLICNGEIFNHAELAAGLREKGHVFRTRSDVEVLVHLYEEHGIDFLHMLNGQFAFALYDRPRRRLLLARDPFGIQPLFYAVVNGVLIFASEIKALLEYPGTPREVNLTALDQLLSFPGFVSPATMFRGIHSLKGGNYLLAQDSRVTTTEYWDLVYPREGEASYDRPESYYIEGLREHFRRSVRYRLQADVPVGLYLSGGLDSSFTAAMVQALTPELPRHAFSVTFASKELSEKRHQATMARHIGAQYHEVHFGAERVSELMRRMVYHAECPVKETYNTCSLELSRAAREQGIKVVLTSEGSDELFAGYVGYKFDRARLGSNSGDAAEEQLEAQLRERLWGDRNLFYERHLQELHEMKQALYAPALQAHYKDFTCTRGELVNKERLANRHPIHQRSYLDFKLRLSDHLLADHGDRMAMAHSVEARYPFLDIDLIRFATTIPPELKLNGFTEKYVVKRAAEGLVPEEIIRREKFEFRGPSSPSLLREDAEWVQEMLSPTRLKRQGIFNPETVERLRKQYSREGFTLHFPFEQDLLIIVLTFNLFLDVFDVSLPS